MLEPWQLHEYQKKAANFQATHEHSALWLDMGLGKTVITLTSLQHLLATKFLKGVLIVAPVRVCRLVWRQEALKWSHTKDLTFSVVMGTKDQRTRALLRKADVYLINYENIKWLAETLVTYFIKKDKELPFDGLVWDELSKMKNSNTQRVKSFKKILPMFKWRTGLTGTPASNGYKDLHGQFLVLDEGYRLGTSKTAFRSRFYYKAGPYKEVPFDDTEETIKKLIGDITMEMSAEDYNPLPDLMINDIQIDLPDDIRAKYDQLEKDFFFHLDNGTEVEVFNAASLTNKCLQFSNGATYPIPGMPMWEPIHSLKLDALEEILDEAGGSPVLCAYNYRSDAERIMERFKHLKPINLTNCKTEKSLLEAMRRWKSGECSLMIGHPACVGPDTEVLTENRGWVRIVEVGTSDRVFDGVDFVHHSGCSYSGYKETLNVFGITMTPDHKIMIDGEWVEACNVDPSEETRRKAVYRWEDENRGASAVLQLRRAARSAASKLCEAQSTFSNTMPSLQRDTRNGGHSTLPHLGRDEESIKRERQQEDTEELLRSRHNHVSRVGHLRELPEGHGGRLLGDDGGSGCRRRSTHQHVFDLVDCGPRHRFLIRNSDGEMFISHNSMGHGVDGLQDNGHILVWFGLNWSLDLYEQFNARIRRQGQGAPVICHRLMVRDTLDKAQSMALDDKAQSQSALRNAVKQYRLSKGH